MDSMATVGLGPVTGLGKPGFSGLLEAWLALP